MNYVIIGASRGLGAGVAEGLPVKGDTVWMVSRTRPQSLDLTDGVERHWVQVDLSQSGWSKGLKEAVGTTPVDLLLHTAGTWESSEDLRVVPDEEFHRILSVNTASFVEAAMGLHDNLSEAVRGWIIAIASTAALDNATGPRAAYAASKFGIRGAVHGLREAFRDSGVGVCCISPGGLASDVPYSPDPTQALKRYEATRIPTSDFIIILRSLLSLSKATCVKEIVMPAQQDLDV